MISHCAVDSPSGTTQSDLQVIQCTADVRRLQGPLQSAPMIEVPKQSGLRHQPSTNLTIDGFKKANLVRANLQGADLHGANLQTAILYEVNLRGANLRKADLHGANLQRADLREDNPQGSYLVSANLQDANLRGANLQGARLVSANLQDANLRFANLQEAKLFRAEFQEANLGGAQNLTSEQLDKACGDDRTSAPSPRYGALRSSRCGRRDAWGLHKYSIPH